jgi:hypothetical protein
MGQVGATQMMTRWPFATEFINARQIGSTGIFTAGDNSLGNFDKSWICS